VAEKVTAFILLVTEIGREYEVKDSIEKVSAEAGVEAETYIVYGEYDVLVKLTAPSLKAIDRAVTRIRKLPGVLRTVTLIAAG